MKAKISQSSYFRPILLGLLINLITYGLINILPKKYGAIVEFVEPLIPYKWLLLTLMLLSSWIPIIIFYYRLNYHAGIVWKKILSQYDLREISPGIRVWIPNRKNKADDPNLWLCPVCFAKREISPIQKDKSYGSKVHTYKCHNCNNSLRIET